MQTDGSDKGMVEYVWYGVCKYATSNGLETVKYEGYLQIVEGETPDSFYLYTVTDIEKALVGYASTQQAAMEEVNKVWYSPLPYNSFLCTRVEIL